MYSQTFSRIKTVAHFQGGILVTTTVLLLFFLPFAHPKTISHKSEIQSEASLLRNKIAMYQS
jgi:hypothetical protein